MAKIPVILEAGRADGKLIKTNSVYDANQEKFLSDKIKEIDDTNNTIKDNINILTNIVNSNKSDIENKLETETNRAIATEGNLIETINNITNINEHATAAGLITVNTLPNSTASNVQQALNELFENATYAGIATPTTNPNIPNSPVFYIATIDGSYSNFGNIEVLKGETVILKWNNGTWTKSSFKPMTDFDSVFDTNGNSLTHELNTLGSNVSELELKVEDVAGDVYSYKEQKVLNPNNILPDAKLEDSSLWLANNATINFVKTEELSNIINFVRESSDKSAFLSTELPYSAFENGKRYRISFDCGNMVGNFKVSLRENKGILGENRNKFILSDTLTTAEGTFRYIDFIFSNENHTDGYDWLELIITNQTFNSYAISEFYVGLASDSEYYIIQKILNKDVTQLDEFNKEVDTKLDEFNKEVDTKIIKSVQNVVVPKIVKLRENSVLDELDSESGWQFVNGSHLIDTDRYYSGNGSISVNCPANTNVILQRDIDVDFSDKIISIMVYCENIANVTACSLMLSVEDTSFSKMAYSSIVPTANNAVSKTWKKYTITPLDWKYQGGATSLYLNNIKKIRISIRTSANGDVTINFNRLRAVQKISSEGCVALLFDDGRYNIFKNAMPILDRYGYSATTYVITEFVGTTQSNAKFMTIEQLRILRDKGWTIGSHTTGHVHLSSLFGEDLEKALRDSHNWLLDNGFSEGSHHIAYPFGEFNAEVKEVTRKYYDTAYTTNERWFPEILGDKMELPRFNVIKSRYTMVEVKSMIDTAKEKKIPLIIYFHNIGTEGAGASEEDWSKAEFEEIVHYIHDCKLSCVTASDIYEMFYLRDNN